MSPENWIAISGIVLSLVTSVAGWLVTWQMGKKKPKLKKKERKGFVLAPNPDGFTRFFWVLQGAISLTFTIFMAYQSYWAGYAAFEDLKDVRILRLIPILATFFLGIMFARSVILLMKHRSLPKN